MLNSSLSRTPVNRTTVFITSVLALLVMIPVAGVSARKEMPPAGFFRSRRFRLPALSRPLNRRQPLRGRCCRKVAAKPAPEQAQEAVGSLSGNVSDATGALIPGVTSPFRVGQPQVTP